MEANNFQKLMQEDERNYQRLHDDQVQSNIWGALSLFRLVGDLVDVFLPRIKDVIVMAAGGRGDGEGGSTPAPKPPSLGPDTDPGKAAPGKPGEAYE